jgi:tetratricopeptide (TPR) repeat protein
MQNLLEYVEHPAVIGNINTLYKGHSEIFDKVSLNITTMTGDCEAMEKAFSTQMFEKAMDEKFLNRVIRNMRGCPNSEVYLEALENYTYLTNVAPEDILAKRRVLIKQYYKRERYNEAIEQIRFILGLKEGVDNIEKSELYYLWGNILEEQGDKQKAAFRYKSATNLNPNFGNAFYKLALMYSENILYPNDKLKDSYRYLLCIDKLEKAKECVQQHSGSAIGKYNTVAVNTINAYIESFKSMCPLQTEAFMLGAEYSTPGKKYIFPGGVMKGETTIIRFYN